MKLERAKVSKDVLKFRLKSSIDGAEVSYKDAMALIEKGDTDFYRDFLHILRKETTFE